MTEKASWGFAEGEEVAPGRFVWRKLGGGKTYEAYLGWDDHLAFTVVLKMVRPDRTDDPKALRALGREAEALRKLSHPLIIRGFDAVVDGDHPHLVLEHLEGPTLSRLIRNHGPLALEQLVPLAVNVSSALHYMHEEGLVHLDVKPRNVVVGSPPRLIDFSIARTFDEAARITGTVGTDLYMAPEQCDPMRGFIGPAADIWGLGVTLYRAVTGKMPFERESDYDDADRTQRFPQLVTEPDPLWRGVPGDLAELIMRCLNPAPDRRPKAGEIGPSLESIVAGLPTRPVLRKLRPKIR
jgi:eukaryotic-like serine/threonine-protein kinase